MPGVVRAKRRRVGSGSRRGDAWIAAAIEAWFKKSARELPWRTVPRDPYAALVAEAMLQQTQVSRVVEFFERFMARFPSVAALAAADEDDVLALWSGLGYYRRARSLHAAARMIVERFGGEVPRSVEGLMELPGVGRYTAGSIASIVFGEAAPIVDGNVMRVVLRVRGRDLDPSAKETSDWVWGEAEGLVNAAGEPGVFNEGLMELGATVCVPSPATPRCDACPVARSCRARAEGTAGAIPRPKRAASAKATKITALVLTRRAARGGVEVLLERRPSAGLWGGLWQPPALEGRGRVPVERVSAWADAVAPGVEWRRAPGFSLRLSHRHVTFAVWRGEVGERARPGPGRRWVRVERLAELALGSAQVRVLAAGGVVVEPR